MTRTRDDDTGNVMAWVELFDDYTAIQEQWLSELLELPEAERKARIGNVWPKLSANGKDVLRQVLASVKAETTRRSA